MKLIELKRGLNLGIIELIEKYIEEFLLVMIILIEILDFFAIIPPEIEYVEKVLAVITMSYLFYKASITEIVFGARKKIFDIIIILSYLFIAVNKIVGFSISVFEEEATVSIIYKMIVANLFIVEKIGFIVGTLALIGISIWFMHIKIKKPSILWMIHENEKPKGLHKITHFLSIYFVLLFFYLLLFSLSLEWLAITVDAPILMIILFFYLFVIVKQGKKIGTEGFLTKVSGMSEEFYERFIELFHHRRKVIYAITGILVLHVLVEIGHYIIPYTTGAMYPWYFEQLGAGHTPITELLILDMGLTSGITLIGVLFIYLLNVIGMCMLFFGPAYIWIQNHTHKDIMPRHELWIFFGTLSVLLINPIFQIKKIESELLIGTDIQTQQIPNIAGIWWTLLIFIIVCAIFYLLSRRYQDKVYKVAKIVVLLNFGYYLYYFFTSMSLSYTQGTINLLKNGSCYLGIHFFLFFMITIAAYVIGFGAFAYRTIRHR